MGRAERRELIREIEERRGSSLLCWVVSDRSPIGGVLYEDALRPFYQQLRELGQVPRLDLFLYCRGGSVDVPWRAVYALRKHAETWEALVPLRANSSATLLCLGADRIMFGRQGEISPIDPSWGWKRSSAAPGAPVGSGIDTISTEDVLAYLGFVREHWAITDQQVLGMALSKLVDRVDAVHLGSLHRGHKHLRDVARGILGTRRPPPDEAQAREIVAALAERVHAHNHAIHVEAAQELGLPAESADPALETLMWRLFEDFEDELRMLKPLDPPSLVVDRDLYEEEVSVVALESRRHADHLSGRIEIRARRNIPAGMVVNVAVNVAAPGAESDDLANVRTAATAAATRAVQAAISQYALVATESTFREGRWVRKA